MAQDYFIEFWIDTFDGRRLHPARIKNRTTGRLTYRQLTASSNLTSTNIEYDTAEEVVQAFLAGASVRFGSSSTTDDRGFTRDGRLVKSFGSTPMFRAANPSFFW